MSFTPTASTPLEELKAKQHQIWNNGDYSKIAWVTVPLAGRLLSAVAPKPGSTVLDVACGTGHVAIEAARAFCDVTGIDYVADLVETARRRAAAEGLTIAFDEADAEALPFADESFDYVVSAIGVMFTADHDRAAAELVRVCKPGGTIGLANWTAEGFIGRLLQDRGHARPAAAGRAAADPVGQRGRRPRAPGRRRHRRQLRDPRRDAALPLRGVLRGLHADLLRADLHRRAAAGREGRAAFRADLVALAHDTNLATDGSFVNDWEYRVLTAERRSS